MKTHSAFSRFRLDESGAVTIDWTVLTAGILGISLAVLTIIGHATDDYGDEIGKVMSSQGIRPTN